MLDQSFSATNFDKIFLRENRKGNFEKSFLKADYFKKHAEFKKIIEDKTALRSVRKLTDAEIEDFRIKLDDINKEKEIIRLNTFKKYADEVLEKKFKFNMLLNPVKGVFTIKKEPSSFYAIKQLQINITKTFKVKQANRHIIIKQLFHLLSDGFPKIVIRTDIHAFYESICQEKLLNKIEENTLLSPSSKLLIKKVFFDYERKKNKALVLPKIGIPRGIGISAYLSELYMRDFDNKVREMEDVIFYARYVDDIIVLFAPKTPSTKGNYLDKIREFALDEKLILQEGQFGKPTKTFDINLPIKEYYIKEITFLGYRFEIIQKKLSTKIDFKVSIELSKDKIGKYETRIKETIDNYNADCNHNESKARKWLIERLKFITGNFHLNHTKRKVKAGAYYSNEMLCLNKDVTTIKSIKQISSVVKLEMARISPPPKIGINTSKLIAHLRQRFDFEKGFIQREQNFYSFQFSKKEEDAIFLKYHRKISKFEMIKSIWSI